MEKYYKWNELKYEKLVQKHFNVQTSHGGERNNNLKRSRC